MSPSPLSPTAVADAVLRATHAVAPLWPLEHFVAVNPFLGLADRPFGEAARVMAASAGARMVMPRAFYAEAIRNGRITDQHLHEALAAARGGGNPASLPADAPALRALALGGDPAPGLAVLPTVADVIDRLTGHEWSRFLSDRVSFWASTYFDAGLASWKSPWRALRPYAAWHAEASIDRTADVMGARGFRAAVRGLPADGPSATAAALERLGVPAEALDRYLHRLLMTIGGWAAYARHHVWNSELYGRTDDTLAELLAVRLACEVALLETFAERGAAAAWSAAIGGSCVEDPAADAALAVDVVLQQAYEIGWQEQMLGKLGTPRATQTPHSARPSAQAVFCIDVRSEVFRRALEAVDPSIETIGFAGFFGFPIEYVPVGMERGGAQCPVLLTPKAVISETVRGEPPAAAERLGAARIAGRRVANAWKAFKQGAISCFAFVGPVGLAYARKLVSDGLGLTRPVPHPRADRVPGHLAARLGPCLEPDSVAGRATGLAPADRLATAEGVLKAMSLTDGFARLVLLAGHGSTTVNNPHATGLDCGACGGHTGEANARVAAAVLNDPAVRSGLRAKGLLVPDDTVFLAGLHDTTTDRVTVYDADAVPPSHRPDLARLEAQLAAAGSAARAERAPALKIAVDHRTDAQVLARSRDWSQVRPEWGLAGCAAFIAAPRHRTAGIDLDGRAFLHSYVWREDADFSVLELIMTAPMVVASWISLQYYASTVDNRVFGSGNKTLHNVVGGLGVLEGNAGDLRTGLPWQSIHDGERYVHEPVRLNVVIEAPLDAMNSVIAKHDGVRALLDNGWLHLWALDDTGCVAHRYDGNLSWSPVPTRALGLAA